MCSLPHPHDMPTQTRVGVWPRVKSRWRGCQTLRNHPTSSQSGSLRRNRRQASVKYAMGIAHGTGYSRAAKKHCVNIIEPSLTCGATAKHTSSFQHAGAVSPKCTSSTDGTPHGRTFALVDHPGRQVGGCRAPPGMWSPSGPMGRPRTVRRVVICPRWEENRSRLLGAVRLVSDRRGSEEGPACWPPAPRSRTAGRYLPLSPCLSRARRCAPGHSGERRAHAD